MDTQHEIDRTHELLAKTEARMTWETHQGLDVTAIKREVEALRERLAELRKRAKAAPADSGRA